MHIEESRGMYGGAPARCQGMRAAELHVARHTIWRLKEKRSYKSESETCGDDVAVSEELTEERRARGGDQGACAAARVADC